MSEPTAAKRNRRKTTIGTVIGARMNKTRRVEVAWLAKHGRYGKYIRRRLVHFVHDELNQSREGDRVEIMETRPLSKNKRWRLVRVLAQAAEGAEAEPAGASAAGPAIEPVVPAPLPEGAEA